MSVAVRRRAPGSAHGARRGGGEHGSGPAPQAYNGLVRSQLADLQRARILGAVSDVASERGAANVSVAHIVERAGVSRRTFYEVFGDRDDCLLAAFEDALSHAAERVVREYGSATGWRERVRAGLLALLALLAFFDEQPRVGRFLVVESLSAGPRVLARRGDVLARLTRAVEDGRGELATLVPLPLTAEGVVGGALTVLHSRMVGERHSPLLELAGPLMGMIVLPYLGGAAARRELERPVVQPPAVAQDRPLSADPFKAAGLRLTYRTVRVLLAAAEHPGGSNRMVGEVAGIQDQGQISKLLNRLQRAGLVENAGVGAGNGMPNAWSLTEQGMQVAQSLRECTPQGGAR